MTTMAERVKIWVEAMRLRTLPVSLSGVVMGAALALLHGRFAWLPATLCCVFALLAQVASNFANEYFDYRNGLDTPGREGPRRGVTEGDITPRQMATATAVTMTLACCAGLPLVIWGGWWMLAIGAAVMTGLLAYSAGPYPLSHHGWGEVAVVLFFGIVPVTLTYRLQGGETDASIWLAGAAIGLLGANVLIVNNYRDRLDDLKAGKHTLSVKLGNPVMRYIYIIAGIAAPLLMMQSWENTGEYAWLSATYIGMYVSNCHALRTQSGKALNRVLGATAGAMLVYTLAFTAAVLLKISLNR